MENSTVRPVILEDYDAVCTLFSCHVVSTVAQNVDNPRKL
jgi:hypothetical protein